MWTIVRKEIIAAFSAPAGFLAIGLFYVFSVLFLWVFDTSFNIINAGFADLNLFFNLAPWLLLFLIPALAMRSFSEEIKFGTLEVLFTRPLSLWQIVMGKFFAIVIVFFIAMLPTTINIWAILELITPNATIDWGSIIGGYLGLVLLCVCFASISSFASASAPNVVSAYLSALILCFVQYYVWEQIAAYGSTYWWYDVISKLGIEAHYISISNGVIKLADLFYFTGLSLLFLVLTRRALQKIKAQ